MKEAKDIASAIVADLRRSPMATPAIRTLRRQYSKTLTAAAPTLIIDVVRLLAAQHTWASRVVAYELLLNHGAAMSRLDRRLVEQMAEGLSDWGSVDAFGVTVAGTAWRLGVIDDAHVMRWARSKDRWLRRLALVATVPLNSTARGGSGDTKRTLAVCRALIDDRDAMVVKALSWALRELSKREPHSVSSFLLTEDARLAPLVRREVRTKLATGRKRR